MKKILSFLLLFAIVIICFSACRRDCECTKVTTVFGTTTDTNTYIYNNDVAKNEQCTNLNHIDTTFYQHLMIEDGDTITVTDPLHIINISCK